MGFSWITHNNKKILYVDYSDCKSDDEMVKLLYEYTDLLKKQPGKTNCLENYESSYGTQHFFDEGKKLGKEVHIHKINKNAALGITGVKKYY